jgi:hypothetical protein
MSLLLQQPQTPAMEQCEFWRELALSGADLSWPDTAAWGESLSRALDELSGGIRVFEALPDSSAKFRIGEQLSATQRQLGEDLRAYGERSRRMVAASDRERGRLDTELRLSIAEWDEGTPEARQRSNARMAAVGRDLDLLMRSQGLPRRRGTGELTT